MRTRVCVLARAALLFAFTACSVAASAQEQQLRTRNLQHQKILRAAGVAPVHVINVADAQFQLSKPFALDESHQMAVAWIRVGEQRAIRVLYRSNSQCVWRLCDATDQRHIGKGFHEFDKQVPIDVTIALLRKCDDLGRLEVWFEADGAISQFQLADRMLKLLTVDREEGLRSGDVVDYRSTYVTREYASTMPQVAVPFSIVDAHLRAANGGRVADPNATRLPPKKQRPNFEKAFKTVHFRIPSYAKHAGGDADLTGEAYLSNDKQLKYLFVIDSEGRAMLAGVEKLDAPVSVLGVRRQYVDVHGMDAPLMEYGEQIPVTFGGRRDGHYQSNWDWVRRQPIIRHFYEATGRTLPE